MNKQLINRTVCALVAIMMASSVGCSSGFKSGNSSTPLTASSTGGSSQAGDQLAQAKAAAAQGQTAVNNATTALSSLNTSSGTIDLSIFENNSGTAGSVLAPIIAKLQPIFDEAYSKVQMVKTQFGNSKAAIAAQMAKLDPADPMYALLSQELTALTDVETKFDTQVHALADKLTLVNTEIDGLVAQATAYIPIPGFSILAGILIDTFIVNDVKTLITNLHDKLMAL